LQSVNVASSTPAEITDVIEKNQGDLQFDEHSDSDIHSNIEPSGSTAYSKRLKSPSYYAERLNKLRKEEEMSDNFASNTNNQVGIYSQPIVKYFNEDSTLVLLEPLPNQMKDVNSCLKYLQLWEQHFEHYQKEITNQ
ncbi:21255_t:CDS:2, partial [Racocetra persica]